LLNKKERILGADFGKVGIVDMQSEEKRLFGDTNSLFIVVPKKERARAKGLEYIRRDWAPIARRTRRRSWKEITVLCVCEGPPTAGFG